jgi:hypothetical protein
VRARTTIVIGSLTVMAVALGFGGGAAGAAPACSLARITNAAEQSLDPAVSADGTSIVFRSDANLTGANADHSSEIFRHRPGSTVQVTPNTLSFGPSVDGDGSVVAFESNADIGGQNPTDTNNVWHWTGGSSFSNISDSGGVGIVGSPSVSESGNATIFRSDQNLTGNNPEVNVELFRVTAFGPPFMTQLTNGGAGAASIDEIEISGQGGAAVFSTTRNVTGANADASREVFIWVLGDGFAQLSNTNGGGEYAQTPSINRDGTVVTFEAWGQSGDNSSEIWRWTADGGLEKVTDTSGVNNSFPDVDGSGNRISFFSTANLTGQNTEGDGELFRWDANTDTFLQLTEGNETFVANTQIDGVGARVVFASVDPLVGANADDEEEVYRATCRTFSDVASSHLFFDDVEWMAANGISTGYGDGTYKPTAPVSRGAMAAFMYRLAGEPLGPFPDPGFSDVDGHPFFFEISWMADEEIAGGYEDGTFRPGAAVSRGAMSAFMYRLGSEPPGPFPNPGFSDVPPSHPFYEEIAWMADEEITGGYEDNTFRPATAVSRQAMSAFMRRFAEGPGIPL